MTLEKVRRWTGYAAVIVVGLLILAFLGLLNCFSGRQGCMYLFAPFFIIAQIMILPLVGIIIAIITKQHGLQAARLSLAGYFIGVLGWILIYKNTDSPVGFSAMLVGLLLVAITVPASTSKLKIGMGGLFLAYLIYYGVVFFIPYGSMSDRAELLWYFFLVFLEGGATLLIATDLLRRDSSGEQPELD